jgi:hypothetical protein
METYNYTRSQLPSGKYDIEHLDRIDGEGNQIYLAKEIELVLSGKKFKVICNNASCDIIFEENLTSEEKTTLDTVVANHKANT